MDILRISTAGSVDDGKSTLIGRLLYETKSITKDKIEALELASKRKGLDFLDLSLLTDGLIAEREQGITIDVANIYFSTPTRKYIIADTPGHFEYTRNMVTGSSNSQVAMILIDARKGVLEQTHRHFYIASLLRIPNVVVCVNKMDLVGYDEVTFNSIMASFGEIANQLKFEGQKVSFIPISSLYGQNITLKSDKMDWYTGNPLLNVLNSIDFKAIKENKPSRFPVQYVIRPKTEEYHDFRGYAGKIASGEFKVGDKVTVLPSGTNSIISTIEKFEKPMQIAIAGESVVIQLADNVDISRGDMIVLENNEPAQSKDITAQICWLDSNPLNVGKMLTIQHGINDAKAKVISVSNVVNMENLEVNEEANSLKLNGIGKVTLKVSRPLFVDKFNENRANGSFILIDDSNGTVGVGFVE